MHKKVVHRRPLFGSCCSRRTRIEFHFLPLVGRFRSRQIPNNFVLAIAFRKGLHGPFCQSIASSESGVCLLGISGRFFEPAKGTGAVSLRECTTVFGDFLLDGIQKVGTESTGVKVKPGLVLVRVGLGNGGGNGTGPTGVVGDSKARDLSCVAIGNLLRAK